MRPSFDRRLGLGDRRVLRAGLETGSQASCGGKGAAGGVPARPISRNTRRPPGRLPSSVSMVTSPPSPGAMVRRATSSLESRGRRTASHMALDCKRSGPGPQSARVTAKPLPEVWGTPCRFTGGSRNLPGPPRAKGECARGRVRALISQRVQSQARYHAPGPNRTQPKPVRTAYSNLKMCQAALIRKACDAASHRACLRVFFGSVPVAVAWSTHERVRKPGWVRRQRVQDESWAPGLTGWC